MIKKKALGHDPLAWIKATQREQARKVEQMNAEHGATEPETPALPADRPATADRPAPISSAPRNHGATNWRFVLVVTVDMILLLTLGCVAYLDLNKRMSALTRATDAVAKEVEELRMRVQRLEQPLSDSDRSRSRPLSGR